MCRFIAAREDFEAILSLAGRTAQPARQLVPTRIGGFGGPLGLARFLRENRIDAVIDATHPFAAQMSHNAVVACDGERTPLLAIERLPWRAEALDRWHAVPSVADAVLALGEKPRTVFSGLGRLSLPELARAPHHRYVIRLIDKPAEDLGLPDVTFICARGPFAAEDDVALFKAHRVEVVLSKNAGGEATCSKILAARALGLPVIMVERPFIPPRPTVSRPEEAISWLEALKGA